MTRVISVDPVHPQQDRIGAAAEVIRAGELVAFPTETVYGLGADALNAEAVGRIFTAKGRPAYNPLIAHAADTAGARRLASRWTDAAERLASSFWPGPLTLVVSKAPHVPDLVTAGLTSVAVRVPAHPVALALIAAAEVPLAAPSANRFTQLSPTTAAHVERGLGDRVTMILDGGPTRVGIESTVVDLTGDAPVLLRPGSIGRPEIEAVVGPILLGDTSAGKAPRASPGMDDRHYAPRAELRTVGAGPAGAGEAATAIEAGRRRGARLGAIVHSSQRPAVDELRVLAGGPVEYARLLYATLHELDDLSCDLILVEQVPDEPAWSAVRDRLRRASHSA